MSDADPSDEDTCVSEVERLRVPVSNPERTSVMVILLSGVSPVFDTVIV